jgi:hypothetical protein
MGSSLADQPDPWIQPKWEFLFEGLAQLAQAAVDFWRGVELATASLVLQFENMVRQLAGRLLCDPLVAFSIQVALESQSLKRAAGDLVKQRPNSRLQNSTEVVKVRMLGGSVQEFVVPYYLIRKRRGPGRPTKYRGPSGNGFYPELELLGIHGRVTPAVASTVAGQLARCPVDEATSILEEQGLELNSKTVTRIGQSLASRALDFVQSLVGRMNAGLKGTACSGLRLAIAIDGGRVRTREPYGRRRRSTRRHRFKGEWREPKVFVIYELDSDGKRKKKGLCIYGGTMGPADECFELLAAHLCFLGAHLATEIVVLADGAEWVWNRLERLLEQTGIKRSAVTEVVDFYHVLERLHEIAKTRVDWTERDRHLWVQARVIQIKSGHLSAMQVACDSVHAALSKYFHNNSLRLDYRGCRRRRLPIGSGAVESGIRRIINLRFKGNGIFWGIENVAGLIHLRCQLLAGRWSKLVESATLPKEHWERCVA